ncbi:MAG: N-acyl homoserine lactonase family protein [Bacillota bacterium]|nr:N-acyl homoserine lactonase family protein [Bacillota bacterium]
MSHWKIYPLVFGWIKCPKNMITTGLDQDIIIQIPYLGFYITNGDRKILIDNGINEKYIVDGKAWAGMPADGGAEYIYKEFERINVDISEIDTVIYTHLHNDHAGNCSLFPDAVHVFQDREWKELLDPLPSMKIRGDFDQSLIEDLKKLNCQRVVGDVEYEEGLKFMLTPGHTDGSMCITVDTKDGKYLIAGDTIHMRHIAYGYLDELKTMEGEIIKVTPAPKDWDYISPSSLVYNHYDWYKSIYKIKSMFKEKQVLTGHGPYLVNKTFG